MSRFLPLLLASVLFVSLTACGQKGDLYITNTPQDTPNQNSPAH